MGRQERGKEVGFVKVSGVMGTSQDDLREVELLADSGSFYTLLPPDLAEQLHISLPLTSTVVLADSRRAEIRVGLVYLKLLDREAAVPVGVLDVPAPLLGVSALEALGLKIDPVEGKLEPSRPFGPAAL